VDAAPNHRVRRHGDSTGPRTTPRGPATVCPAIS
jgi:hypothetical protein